MRVSESVPSPCFPFSAIVGQDELRSALMLAAIDPGLGGVLALGDRGTGKSTAVRALAALLPPIVATTGCRWHCDPARPCAECAANGERRHSHRIAVPVVDLPLGVTEDRVVGSLDLERALVHGERAFEPGLLARAHRGFLYIDEVNLLEDHIVDLLLDVAASGENVVEREGMSLRHPARFVLIGSGNPEEGELRPQLLDRFGLAVEVRTPSDLAERVEVVRRRDSFDRDPDSVHTAYAPAQTALRRRLMHGRRLLAAVAVSDDILVAAARLCLALGTDGLRGELTLVRAARALTAFEGRKTVTVTELKRVAAMALRHRLRRNPLDETVASVRVERAVAETLG